MGTPEEKIFVDPSDRDDLPDVIDDFELDFNAGSEEWLRHVANGENLKKFTEKTELHIMNPPREGFPLLVCDLDHCLLDFSSKAIQRDQTGDRTTANAMKRYVFLIIIKNSGKVGVTLGCFFSAYIQLRTSD